MYTCTTVIKVPVNNYHLSRNVALALTKLSVLHLASYFISK